MKNRIVESEGVIIYGAGKQGDIAMRILYNEGLYGKINCFAVSDEPENVLLGLKDVLKVEKAHERYPDSLYLLAVVPGTKAYSDMRERMDRIGVHDFLQMTDFLEKFNYI